MQALALAGAGPLTTLGLLLGAGALLGLWVRTRRLDASGIRRRTVSLGGQHALHVVEVEGRRLVVGTGPSAAPHLLTELSPGPGSGPERSWGAEGTAGDGG